MRIASALVFAAFVNASLAAGTVSAQSPYPYPGYEQAGYSQVSSRTSTDVQTTSYERNTGRNNPALNFYGRPKASGYGSHSRSVQPSPPIAVQTKPMGKPFSSYRASSTISPYLRLDYVETDTSTPNYYMFVRPAIDQNYVNRETRNENRALRATVRQASAGGAVTSPAGGIPTTGHSTQFMNGGGYYPTAR